MKTKHINGTINCEKCFLFKAWNPEVQSFRISDKEIEDYFNSLPNHSLIAQHEINGAKWLRDKILKTNQQE